MATDFLRADIARRRLRDASASAGERLDDVRIAANFARDLPGWIRGRLTDDEAALVIRRRLAARERRFLDNADALIFGNPSSPYRELLRHAGCEPGDLRALVERDGLDAALSALAARGVYVTLDEMKGRTDAVRGSARFRFHREQFEHPRIRAHVVVYSGGTRGRPTRIRRSLDMYGVTAASQSAAFNAFGLRDAQHILWLTGPIGWLLSYTRIGRTPTHWFHPVSPLPARVRIGARALQAYGRLCGVSFPLPHFADLQQPERFARWLDRQRGGRPLVVTAVASAATRVAIAAQERGIRLDHVTFTMTSEPTTPARQAHLDAAGARAIVHYAAREAPNLTFSCATPDAVDDVHVMTDCYAIVSRSRSVGQGGPAIDALLISSLTAESSTILLNAELGDYAQVTRRDCGCSLGALGLTTHLQTIRSFEKLTGEGVTFGLRSLEELVEQELPARFGGASLDYQLVEYEATDSSTRVSIRVHPRVGPLDEGAVVATVLAALERGGMVDAYQASLWRSAGTLAVVREAPLATAVGKVLPFHLVRAPQDRQRQHRGAGGR